MKLLTPYTKRRRPAVGHIIVHTGMLGSGQLLLNISTVAGIRDGWTNDWYPSVVIHTQQGLSTYPVEGGYVSTEFHKVVDIGVLTPNSILGMLPEDTHLTGDRDGRRLLRLIAKRHHAYFLAMRKDYLYHCLKWL